MRTRSTSHALVCRVDGPQLVETKTFHSWTVPPRQRQLDDAGKGYTTRQLVQEIATMVSPEGLCQKLTMRKDKSRLRLLRSVAVEPSESSLGTHNEIERGLRLLFQLFLVLRYRRLTWLLFCLIIALVFVR